VFTPVLCGVPPAAVIDAGVPELDPVTVTEAEISGIEGGAPARMTAVPGLTPVTMMTTVVNSLPSG
jgi:hypothetical protein